MPKTRTNGHFPWNWTTSSPRCRISVVTRCWHLYLQSSEQSHANNNPETGLTEFSAYLGGGLLALHTNDSQSVTQFLYCERPSPVEARIEDGKRRIRPNQVSNICTVASTLALKQRDVYYHNHKKSKKQPNQNQVMQGTIWGYPCFFFVFDGHAKGPKNR